jgi:ferrous-iron efflux pump FieF
MTDATQVRAPTAEERTKETSFLYFTLADTAMTMLLILVAIASGSLTMLSEATRSALMLAVQFYALWALFAIHRRRLARFEFGAGKIEEFVSVVVGLGLCISGLWIAQTVVGTLFTAKQAASPLGLTLAAVTNAINALLNVTGWLAMVFASDKDDSEVYRAQLRARLTMMVSSLFLQVTLTIAAVAKDAAIALFLDAVGATFVAGLMLYNGVSMMSRGLPHLLDAPASQDLKSLIRRAASKVMASENIVAIRTRRAGTTTFVEITVAPTAFPSLASLHDGAAAIRGALRRGGAEIDLVLVPAAPPSPASGQAQAADP